MKVGTGKPAWVLLSREKGKLHPVPGVPRPEGNDLDRFKGRTSAGMSESHIYIAIKKQVPDHVYASWDQSEPVNTSDVDHVSHESDSDDPVSEAWDSDIVAAASTVFPRGEKRRSVSLSDAAETPEEHRHFKKTKFEHTAATEDCWPTFPVPDLQNTASSDSETGSDNTTRPPLHPRDRVPSQRRSLHTGSSITPPCPFVLYTQDEVRLWGRVQGQDVDGKLFINPWSSEYTMETDFNLPL
ncbi:hypothetical protein FIBSPDRAFT_868469 [Athelia psychrophila]|uniref:Uncharacterized protein n=1 Tax=Athelia psychrophila TaxID=1759441 RepID=A0A166D281_9AGAM|nr:hypothetical protein FIBSPDRAFT_868469 [Fibularhizoctonia sp. CBS 109695]